MKNFTLFILLFLFGKTGFIFAQPNCAAGTATETLNTTNAKITLSSTGIWAYDPSGNTAYEWPYSEDIPIDGPGIISAGNFWMGGYDNGGNLHMSGKTYGQGNDNGFWPGPINSNTLTTNEEDCANWDKLFKVTQSEIESFLSDYNDNDQLDDPIPESILGWPANGNVHFVDIHGFDLPETNSNLAPYYDENGDAEYNPLDGDYPQIKCADQAVWWVFNDLGNAGFLNTDPIGVEVQIMAYAYESSSSNIANTSFYDIKTIYRRDEALNDVYMGLWMDTDLGCPYDDYLGVVPEENLVYVYNADAVDGQSGLNCQGISTYGQEPPMVGIKMLRGPLDQFGGDIDTISSFIALPDESTPLPPSPTYAFEYYRVMSGIRADGAPYLNPNNEITKFLYSGNPANANQWSMCSEETSISDQRFFMSVGPVDYFLPGSTNLMTFSVTVQPQPSMPCPDVADLINDTNLHLWTFNNPGDYCDMTVNTNEVLTKEIGLSVFPNPATDFINFRLSEEENFTTIRLYRMDGQLVRKEENLKDDNVKIAREDLATGTYIYQIQTQAGVSVSGKFLLE